MPPEGVSSAQGIFLSVLWSAAVCGKLHAGALLYACCAPLLGVLQNAWCDTSASQQSFGTMRSCCRTLDTWCPASVWLSVCFCGWVFFRWVFQPPVLSCTCCHPSRFQTEQSKRHTGNLCIVSLYFWTLEHLDRWRSDNFDESVPTPLQVHVTSHAPKDCCIQPLGVPCGILLSRDQKANVSVPILVCSSLLSHGDATQRNCFMRRGLSAPPAFQAPRPQDGDLLSTDNWKQNWRLPVLTPGLVKRWQRRKTLSELHQMQSLDTVREEASGELKEQEEFARMHGSESGIRGLGDLREKKKESVITDWCDGVCCHPVRLALSGSNLVLSQSQP